MDILNTELIQQINEYPLTFAVANQVSELMVYQLSYISYKFLIIIFKFNSIPWLYDDLVNIILYILE